MATKFAFSAFAISLFFCVTFATFARSQANAQDPQAELRQKLIRDQLTRFDANGNGVLEPEEWKAPATRQRFVLDLAQKAGLDPQQSLPVDRLLQAASGSVASGTDAKPVEVKPSPPITATTTAATASTTVTTTPGTSSTASAPKTGTPNGSSSTPPSKSESGSKPSVAGFDSSGKPQAVAGFGTKPDSGSNKSATGSSSGRSVATTTSSFGTGSTAAPTDMGRYREMAKGIVKKYDKDNDLFLRKDKGEWDGFPSSVKDLYTRADADKDNVITVDELAIALAAPANGDKKEGASTDKVSSSNSSSSGGSSRDSRDSRRDSREKTSGKPGTPSVAKSYRQIPPTERLPKGLPDWFIRNDADGDGQIKMSEFSSLWNESKVAEFATFDLDGDGFITLKECLKKVEPKK